MLWGEFTAPPVNHNKVTYIHGDDLISWLTSLSIELSAGQVLDASTALNRSFESVTMPVPRKVKHLSGDVGKRGTEAA